MVHMGKDSPIKDSSPKIPLIHIDGDTSHINNYSPTQLPPSSSPHISPPVTVSDQSKPGCTPSNNTQPTWKKVTRAATGSSTAQTQNLGSQKRSLNNT